MTSARLRDDIRAAFAATPRPDDDHLVADATARDPEGREVAAAFAGLAWPDVPAGLVREHATALPLFTPPAFRYFLPAYLTRVVDDFPGQVDAAQSVVFNLVPPDADTSWAGAPEFFTRRTQGFTAAESRAVAAFLDLVAALERDDPTAPLDDVRAAARWWRERGGRGSSP